MKYLKGFLLFLEMWLFFFLGLFPLVVFNSLNWLINGEFTPPKRIENTVYFDAMDNWIESINIRMYEIDQ